MKIEKKSLLFQKKNIGSINKRSSEPSSFKSISLRVIFTMFPFPFALLHQQTNLPNLKFTYTHLCKNTKKNKIHPMMEVKGTKQIWVNSVCVTRSVQPHMGRSDTKLYRCSSCMISRETPAKLAHKEARIIKTLSNC